MHLSGRRPRRRRRPGGNKILAVCNNDYTANNTGYITLLSVAIGIYKASTACIDCIDSLHKAPDLK